VFDGGVEAGLGEERGASEAGRGPDAVHLCGLTVEGDCVYGRDFIEGGVYVYS